MSKMKGSGGGGEGRGAGVDDGGGQEETAVEVCMVVAVGNIRVDDLLMLAICIMPSTWT